MLTRLRLITLLTVVLIGVFAVSALASSGKTVKIGDDYYGPKALTVGKGTKVTWKWVGVLRHNVVVHTGPSAFSSKTQVSGTFTHTFTKKGTYHLVCTIHPNMKMTVVVK
ncbi:MAG TPA: plastocyanin/azurin family copper-binding protein [Solirubrobacteraceae bacterium]|nr:plastocyanin/azurin family copper-binding protein [Solirubrobacteraceae bacterium]